MKRHLPTFLLSALILALLMWYFRPSPTPTVTRAILPAPAAPAALPQPNIENQNSKIPPPPPLAATERSHLADQLNAPGSSIRADLQIVAEILGAFRTNFPRDGNPVGLNAEITAVLTGQNKLRLALLPPDHPAINRDGELCDRWGTPFFFHAESGTKMTIASAGPDKKRHTADDEVFTP